MDVTFFSALGAVVPIHRANCRDGSELPTTLRGATLLDRPSHRPAVRRRAPHRDAWGRQRARTTASESRNIYSTSKPAYYRGLQLYSANIGSTPKLPRGRGRLSIDLPYCGISLSAWTVA
jgi:hypothetical protein